MWAFDSLKKKKLSTLYVPDNFLVSRTKESLYLLETYILIEIMDK